MPENWFRTPMLSAMKNHFAMVEREQRLAVGTLRPSRGCEHPLDLGFVLVTAHAAQYRQSLRPRGRERLTNSDFPE